MVTTFSTQDYIRTILIYMCAFVPTLFFAYMNNKALRKKKHKGKILFSAVMVILIPAILAGVRDETVGTDVLYYAKNTLFIASKSDSYVSYVHTTNSSIMSSLEFGYMFLVYILSRFTSDFHWLLFVTSIFINALIYLCLYRTRNLVSITLGEMLFLFTAFNESLNIMRQCMAMSIVLLAVTYLIEYRYRRSILIVFFSCLFHLSGIVGFVIIFIYYYLEKRKNKETKNKNLKLAIVCVGLLAVLLFFGQIEQMLSGVKLLGGKFSTRYLSGTIQGDFSLLAFVVYSIGAIILFTNRQKIQNHEFWIAMCLFDVILYALRMYVFSLYRIATYFFYCRLISLSQFRFVKLKKLVGGKITKKETTCLLITGYALLYWVILIIRFKYNGTMPYTSAILGIN